MTLRTRTSIGVVALCACLVLVSRVALSAAQSGRLSSKLGYFIVLAAFVWLAKSLWQVLWPIRTELARSLKSNIVACIFIILAAGYLHLHEPHVFKVLYDEPSHVAGSLVMHQNREASLPARAHLSHGDLLLMDSFPSFRLYSFQVLLSLVHDLTGYRQSNVFFLNGALTIVLLTVSFSIGCRIGGRTSGALLVLLLCSLPLLAQNVTSGGYDVLNLTLLAGLVWASLTYVSEPTSQRLTVLTSVCVLLALSRHESAVYVIVPATCALYVWKKRGSLELPLLVALSPLFLLPVVWTNKILVGSDTFMATDVAAALGTKVFSLANLSKNMGETIFYLFSVDLDATNSILLSLMGVLGVLVMIVRVGLTLARREIPAAREIVLLVFMLLVLGLYALVLANFWGMPTDAAAARFSLPLHFLFAVLAVWMVADHWRNAVPRWLLILSAGYLLLVATPACARHSTTNQMVVSRSYRWFLEYIAQHDDGRTLYVSKSCLPMIVAGYPAVDLRVLNENGAKSFRCVQAKYYDRIVFHQMYWIRPENGAAHTNLDPDLSSDFTYEVIAENRFLPDAVSRIVRLTGYREKSGTVVTPQTMPPLQTTFPSRAAQLRYMMTLLP